MGKILGEGCRICDFLQIGWWRGNWRVFQESCAQPEDTILPQIGNISSPEELKNTVMYIP